VLIRLKHDTSVLRDACQCSADALRVSRLIPDIPAA
jgi:hypothetical protein